jgi:hypothetical protein
VSGLWPWEKSPQPLLSLFFLFLFLFFLLSTSRKQSVNQNQTLWHPGSLAHGKPPYTMLHWKQHHFSPKASSKAACMKLQKVQVSITPHLTYPPLREDNPGQPLGWLNTPPSKTENHKQWSVI